MKHVFIENTFAATCPALRVGVIQARVTNSESDPILWQLIGEEEARIAATYRLDEINKRPAIQATRKAYRSFGKDPNRYRVSSEALCRRIVKGMGIYRIDTLVDLGNLVSIRAGYSIGAFDANRIDGDSLTLGVGREGELFHGIGRGTLNIEGLPVYRDRTGGIGTPTSDEERTKISLDTRHLLLLINAYGEEMPLDETIDWTVELLQRFVAATDITTSIVSAGMASSTVPSAANSSN